MAVVVLDQAAVDLIKEFEGFIDHWYPDPAHGWKVPTCCYGHTDAAGEPKYAATKAKTFTKAEGEAILRRDLNDVVEHVSSKVKVTLNPYQFGALVSFTFNLGAGNFDKSTLLKKVNAGDYAGAAKEFAKWNKAGGQVLKGLTRRRAAEAALFAGNVPETVIVTTPVGPPSVEVPEPPQTNGRLFAALIAVVAALGAGLLKLFGVN